MSQTTCRRLGGNSLLGLSGIANGVHTRLLPDISEPSPCCGSLGELSLGGPSSRAGNSASSAASEESSVLRMSLPPRQAPSSSLCSSSTSSFDPTESQRGDHDI
uniref:Uncharacterized protein n=1 Tax=Triticum urartu TaxID=4572 RepID=A0A8R7VGG9_TRIUA